MKTITTGRKIFSACRIMPSYKHGNLLNWAYIATIGFPIQFVVFYVRRFIRNLLEKQRARNLQHNDLTLHTIFTVPLTNAWGDIKRIWRNLLVKAYAGVTMNRW